MSPISHYELSLSLELRDTLSLRLRTELDQNVDDGENWCIVTLNLSTSPFVIAFTSMVIDLDPHPLHHFHQYGIAIAIVISIIIRIQTMITTIRIYPWGIVDIEDPTHCDFSLLRRLLLSSHTQVVIIIALFNPPPN